MKKIPTLFERIFEGNRVIGITPNVTHGCEWVLEGKGIATLKFDGACCAIINGDLYKRYDAKKGKKPPEGAIPCCEPDAVTGHHPHWVIVNKYNPSDKWFIRAYKNTKGFLKNMPDGTYEAVGPHFQKNPYNLSNDILLIHGIHPIKVPRTFEGIKQYLANNYIEGIVFWLDGEPKCKIKRSDFGLAWR